jgi:hypothetical protein
MWWSNAASKPVGPVSIFDDIRSHKAVQKAWNDFQESRGLHDVQLINNIDNHSAYFQKKT